MASPIASDSTADRYDFNHKVSIDFIGRKLRIDAYWIDLNERQARLFAHLLQEPQGVRSVGELTRAVYGKVDEELGKADRRVDDLFRYFRRAHLEPLFEGEERIEAHTFWERVRGGYRVKAPWIVEPVSGLLRGLEDSIAGLLNRSLTQLYWLIRERRIVAEDDAMVRATFFTLRDIAQVCRQIWKTREPDETTLNWFNCMVRIAVYLNDHGQPQWRPRLLDLGEQLEESQGRLLGELWAMEWRALYLELVGGFAAAARASEQLALRTQDIIFSAALYARAAQCFERNGELRQAARRYIQSADQMARGGRVSIQAVEYYQAALRLWPDSPERGRIEADLKRQSLALQRMRDLQVAAALVANTFDRDIADALVHPLNEMGIRCDLLRSNEIDDLTDLAPYRAIIIVGGIKAQDTDYHVHKHFYEVPSRTACHTFKLLDVQVQHYCDRWHIDLDDQPVYVLAGLSRQETCQAVQEFIDAGELPQLVRRR